MTTLVEKQPSIISTSTTLVEIKENQHFVYCPATNYTSKVCIDCLDRPLMKDDQCEMCNYRGEPLCAHCSCLWFPFAFAYDFVSCPIRGIKYCHSQ